MPKKVGAAAIPLAGKPDDRAAPYTVPMMAVPTHWSPEQALAVLECLQALRQALWAAYGPQVQQAWREQLVHDHPPPQLDPDEPF